MLIDEIKGCIEETSEYDDTINSEILNNFLNTDYRATFDKYKDLKFVGYTNSSKVLSKIFPDYFTLQDSDDEEETVSDDDIVYLCLTYMSYIYYKQKNSLFNTSSLICDLDLEYNSILHNRIYPEILSLYRIILESKKYKHRGDKITLTYKQDKIDINTCAWFLDDMDEYFKTVSQT